MKRHGGHKRGLAQDGQGQKWEGGGVAMVDVASHVGDQVRI